MLSIVHERSICYVRGYSLDNCCRSRRAMATRLARLAYRRGLDSPAPHSGGHCAAVQPLCGKTQKIVGQVSHITNNRGSVLVRQ